MSTHLAHPFYLFFLSLGPISRSRDTCKAQASHIYSRRGNIIGNIHINTPINMTHSSIHGPSLLNTSPITIESTELIVLS